MKGLYMKKLLSCLTCLFLLLMMLCSTVFAAEMRWENVAAISPTISSRTDTYTSVVTGLTGTTKIDCTLVLYEKGLFGSYTEVSRSSDVYYGSSHEFSGSYDIKEGKTYKLTTTATVTTNGHTETVTTSFEKKC